jgi:hypothetical protein
MVRNILFLASNPTDTGRLRLDKEFREISEGLKRSNYREQFQLTPVFAVRVSDLRRSWPAPRKLPRNEVESVA